RRDDRRKCTAPEGGINTLDQGYVGLAHGVLPFNNRNYGKRRARFHAPASARSARSISNACALRPPRSIEVGAASQAISCAARSRQRLARWVAPSVSSLESRTISTLRSMSSLDQPREWAM